MHRPRLLGSNDASNAKIQENIRRYMVNSALFPLQGDHIVLFFYLDTKEATRPGIRLAYAVRHRLHAESLRPTTS